MLAGTSSAGQPHFAVWTDKAPNPRRLGGLRDIITPPPPTLPTNLGLGLLSQAPAGGGGCLRYRRGVPSPLVKKLGNPNLAVRPLRAALYARMGLTGGVREVFPVWDKGSERVRWTDDVGRG